MQKIFVMGNVTICTFNVENLFVRYKVFGYLAGDKFKRKILAEKELEEHGGFLPGYSRIHLKFLIRTTGAN
jgi:hypothetical protein